MAREWVKRSPSKAVEDGAVRPEASKERTSAQTSGMRERDDRQQQGKERRRRTKDMLAYIIDEAVPQSDLISVPKGDESVIGCVAGQEVKAESSQHGGCKKSSADKANCWTCRLPYVFLIYLEANSLE